MIGQKIGSYEVLEEIGKGGMSTVFRAMNLDIKREVALKIINEDIANEPGVLRRLQREAQLSEQLHHPHILPIYKFELAHTPPYIVMQYIVGRTLDKLIAENTLAFADVIRLLQQICSAVDYAHQQGIVHRDLKPSNILIDSQDNALVMDFGIARMTLDEAGKGITETGVTIGTPDYMSPEQAMGDATDLRTDVYALGVMLFELSTGRKPYDFRNPMAVMMGHIKDPIPSAFELNDSLPNKIDLLIERAMAKDPDERYQTVDEFSKALSEVAG